MLPGEGGGGAYDDVVAVEEGDFETPEGVYIHPGQTALKEGPFDPAHLAPCFWCGAPATFGRIHLGGKAPVDACAFHYHTTIAPAFAAREAEREAKRKANALARRSSKR